LLLAFIGGGIVVWVLDFLRSWWLRPILRVQLSIPLGSLVETTSLLGNAEVAKQKYVRAVVWNSGRSLASNCSGTVYEIRITSADGNTYVFSSDLIELTWALSHEVLNNIPARSHKILDVCHTMLPLIPAIDGTVIPFSIHVDGAHVPVRLLPQLIHNARYDFKILFYADNTKPIRANVGVDIAGKWDDVRLRS